MKALITAPFGEKYREALEKYMSVEYKSWIEAGRLFTEEELIDRAKDKDVLIVELDQVTGNVINQCPKLTIVGCCRGGPVNIDIDSCTKKGIPVLRTPGRNSEAVAEMTVGLMIALTRHIIPAYEWLKAGNWTPDTAETPEDPYARFRGNELWGKTVGIIGLGAVGSKVASMLGAFGTKLIGYDPYLPPEGFREFNVEPVKNLESIFRNADIVTVHMSVTKETSGLIGARELNLMKSSAYFVNVARAALVDNQVLYKLLSEKKIAGAAVDVLAKEPATPQQEPLLKLENVIATPHICGATYEVVDHHSAIMSDDVIRILHGEKPRYIVNPETLDNRRKGVGGPNG